jgi:hypothetical protein
MRARIPTPSFLRIALPCLLVGGLNLWHATSAHAACVTPPYRVVRNFINTNGYGSAHISLRPETFTTSNLLCLAEELQRSHPKWNNIIVLFFSSDDAAENFDASGMGDWRDVIDGATGRSLGSVNIGHFRNELRALYKLDRSQHISSLEILPLGLMTTDEYATKTTVPAAAIHCQARLANRCVLAMKPIEFPGDALSVQASGHVTVAGVIRQDGMPSDLQVVSVAVVPAEATNQLVAGALENLATWWLEPGSREDAFDLTYVYTVEPSGVTGRTVVQVEMPEQIVVIGSPAK